MKKIIAAAAFAAAPWQPAHAQTILGSIPEEFRGDWCWPENSKGEEIFRRGECKLKIESLEHRSHDPRHEPPVLRFRQRDGERRHPQDADALHQSPDQPVVNVWCPTQAATWQEEIELIIEPMDQQ